MSILELNGFLTWMIMCSLVEDSFDGIIRKWLLTRNVNEVLTDLSQDARWPFASIIEIELKGLLHFYM